MQVLRLIQRHGFDLQFSLGDELGYGADGQIFSLLDHKDKVIKLCVSYDNYSYEYIDSILSYLETNNDHICVRVCEHAYIGSGSEKSLYGERNFILYYYIMDRLNKISEDEKKVFHSILSHEDMNVNKQYSLSTVSNMLHGMQKGLDFDYNKVIYFYNEIKLSKLDHRDMHVRNIMKDNVGNFKLIDFDRARIKNESKT